MKLAAMICTLALFGAAWAQEPSKIETSDKGLISVEAKGIDVRNVLHDLFTQSKKNYVLDPGVRFVLYLNLREVEFEEALAVILRNAGLGFELQNGIYFVARAKPTPVMPAATPKPTPKPEAALDVKPVPPRGPLSRAVLDRRVTTRFQKTDFRAVMSDLTRQTGVSFEISPDIPAYKLDAFLVNTSLKFALDTITRAAGLSYTFTQNQSILIAKAPETGKVEIVAQGNP